MQYYSLQHWTLLPSQVTSTANLDSIFKSRDINFRLVKAMVFPVVMYGCKSWTVKKAEHRIIDALNCGVGEES